MSEGWGVVYMVVMVLIRGFRFLWWVGSFSRSFIIATRFYVVCHRVFLGVLDRGKTGMVTVRGQEATQQTRLTVNHMFYEERRQPLTSCFIKHILFRRHLLVVTRKRDEDLGTQMGQRN